MYFIFSCPENQGNSIVWFCSHTFEYSRMFPSTSHTHISYKFARFAPRQHHYNIDLACVSFITNANRSLCIDFSSSTPHILHCGAAVVCALVDYDCRMSISDAHHRIEFPYIHKLQHDIYVYVANILYA